MLNCGPPNVGTDCKILLPLSVKGTFSVELVVKDSAGNERTTDPIEFKVIPCNSPFVFPTVFMDKF